MKQITLLLTITVVLVSCSFRANAPKGWELKTHTKCITVYLENATTSKVDTFHHITSVSAPGNYSLYRKDSLLATYPSDHYVMKHRRITH